MVPDFVDTSFLVAELNPRDPLHFKAQALRRINLPLLTSELVLIEFLNAFASGRHRQAVLERTQAILSDPSIIVVRCSHQMFAEALDLFARRPDKGWSLTDCASFLIMRSERMTRALTADSHFRQAGFTALMLD